jgi:hypothetical protein
MLQASEVHGPVTVDSLIRQIERLPADAPSRPVSANADSSLDRLEARRNVVVENG